MKVQRLDEKFLSNNQINKKKYYGKKNVGSTLMKRDAGNVEYNIGQFNKGFGSPDGGNMTGDGASCCGESLEMNEAEPQTQQDANYIKHEIHQKYKDWNKDDDDFVRDRYTPYVTTKRVKRTLEKQGYDPVEAYGIMMDIQKGHQKPKHVTIQTTDDGESWTFRNEDGGRMFELEEDMTQEFGFEPDDLLDIFNKYGDIDEATGKQAISFDDLVFAVTDDLGKTNPDEVNETLSNLIACFFKQGILTDFGDTLLIDNEEEIPDDIE